MRYIDLFSGCGGLSLGLKNAGFEGVIAVEKSPEAFETFNHNLLQPQTSHYDWPNWFPMRSIDIKELIDGYSTQLEVLGENVDAIVGGPPCQGFSLAGRRNKDDPRNKLSELYIRTVELVRPKYLLFENVKGFNTKFRKNNGSSETRSYAEIVKEKLELLGYRVFSKLLNSAEFGVPQSRERFILLGVRGDVLGDNPIDPFQTLEQVKINFLNEKGLVRLPTRSVDAISDLETTNANLVKHSGSPKSQFFKLDYKQPKELNSYLRLMRDNSETPPNSMRLARHKPATVEKFKKIRELITPGKSLSEEQKNNLGIKKQVITVLAPNLPSRTVTTLPDDLLHYSEHRILTVRENARLQSFPDTYKFLGKYTTGGERRASECPRYTQVGNAVPPLLAEALGKMLIELNRVLSENNNR